MVSFFSKKHQHRLHKSPVGIAVPAAGGVCSGKGQYLFLSLVLCFVDHRLLTIFAPDGHCANRTFRVKNFSFRLLSCCCALLFEVDKMSGDDFFSSDQDDQALFESLPSKIVNPKLKEDWFVSHPAGTSFKIANLGLRYSCGEIIKG